VESARLNLTYSRVTAPLTGRVGLRMVDPGNMVHASDQGGLAVITPTQPINVVFTIPGDSIQQVLKKQAAAPMGVEAFDRDLKNRIASGRLIAIDNQVDPGTGTVKLKAQFANEDQSLFPNQFVNAQLQLDTLKDAILVPTAAVQRSPQGSFVFVVKADATVEMRMVDVQAVEGDRTALRKGLSAGESVVIEGIERLRDGSKVSLPQAGGPKK
jgi:multidrug efflux system membrane fusion protein